MGRETKGKFEFFRDEREKMVSMEQLFAPRVITEKKAAANSTKQEKKKRFKQSSVG